MFKDKEDRAKKLLRLRKGAARFAKEVARTASLGLVQGFSLGLGLNLVNRNMGKVNFKVLNGKQPKPSDLKVAA